MTNFVSWKRDDLLRTLQVHDAQASHALHLAGTAWRCRNLAATSAKVETFDRLVADIFVVKMFLDYLSPAGAPIPEDEHDAILLLDIALDSMCAELVSLDKAMEDFDGLSHINHLFDSTERLIFNIKKHRDSYLALKVGREDWTLDRLMDLVGFERRIVEMDPKYADALRMKRAQKDFAAHKAAATQGESLLRKASAPVGSKPLSGMKPQGFA